MSALTLVGAMLTAGERRLTASATAWADGLILSKNRFGNRPITKNRMISGTSVMTSRAPRSRTCWFSGLVIGPCSIRRMAQSRYHAAMMMPSVPNTAKAGLVWKAPSRMLNSPTNPLRPGSPTDESATMINRNP